jgi:CRP-like cAMP-binding protein
LPCSSTVQGLPVGLDYHDIGSERGITMKGEKILDRVLKKIRGKEGTIISVLRTVPIFQGLAFSDLKKIEIIVHERTFMPDEVIFHEKQPGAGMYIIKTGRVRLAKTINEKKVKIAELKENEFFGEMSLLEDYPRSAEATAVEKTEVLGIFRPDLFDLIESNPRLGSKILLGLSQRLASRLRETTEMRLKGME